jgi:hypothetical protein
LKVLGKIKVVPSYVEESVWLMVQELWLSIQLVAVVVDAHKSELEDLPEHSHSCYTLYT